MANGPLGGFMPTPPSPGQPPQVKLETSAESRGAFNKFLGTLPRNGAIAPIQTGVVPSSTAPVSPVTSNVNIFQPQMSQMAPMAPMPMMPPAQPIKMMQEGGVADFGDFFDEVTSYADDDRSDFSDSGNNFDEGFTEEEDPDRAGDYQTDDSGIFTGTGGDDSPPPVVDTRPRTNITNVGPTSNLRFDPQFTADLLGRRFGDSNISGFMAPADFAQTRQGGATDQTSTVGLPSLGLGQNLLTQKPTVSRQDVLTAANRLSDVAPAASVPLAPTSPFFDRDLLDDPLGLGIRTGFGPTVDAIEEGRARARAFPSAGTPVASLRGGIDRLISPPNVQTGPPSITTIEDDLIQGRGLGENINNPGNIRTGGGFDGEIGKTRDGFAIFDSMKSGVDAINKLSTTYGKERNINTVREFANRYSPVGENTAKEVAGKINLLSNALGVGPDEKVNFADPKIQAKLTPAIITSEIGPKRAQNVANVLRGFDPKPLDDANVATEPFTSFDVTPSVDTNLQALERSANNLPANISLNNLIAATTPGTPQYEATRGDDLSSIEAGGSPFAPNTLFNFDRRPDDFEEPVGTPGALRLGDQLFAPGTGEFRFSPAAVTLSDQRDLNEMRQIDDDEFNPKVIEAYERGSTLGKALANDFLNANRMPGIGVSNFLNKTPTLSSNLTTAGSQFGRGSQVSSPPNIRPNLQEQVARGIRDSADRDAAALSLGIAPFTRQDTGVSDRVRGTGDAVENLLQAGRREELLNRGQLAERDKVVQEMEAIDREPDPIDTTNITETALGGRGTAPTTDLTRGPQVSIVGDDPIAPLETRDIVGDVTQERVADILNRPDRFKDTFKIGDAEFPNLIATLANKAGSFFDRRLFDGIVKKGLDAVVDPDTGRIIGAKDEFGNLIEGRDLEQFRDEGGDSDPIGTFLKKATEDKEEKDTTPNVFGGGTPRKTLENVPTVVSSPFQARDINFRPVGFDAGNLNKLIERITGVPSPRRMQEGGTVAAVDRFLSKVA